MVPVVYLLQFSPFEYRRALLDGAQQRNIVVEAYIPLGTGRHLSNQTVQRMASHTSDELPHMCSCAGPCSMTWS